MKQKINEILLRLKRAEFRRAEAALIIEEINKEYSQEEKKQLVEQFKVSRPDIIAESDNRDFLDVIDHVINNLDND